MLDDARPRQQLPKEESAPLAPAQAAAPMPEIRRLNTARDWPARRREKFGPAPADPESETTDSEAEGSLAGADDADAPAAANVAAEAAEVAHRSSPPAGASGAAASALGGDQGERDQMAGAGGEDVESGEKLH